MFDIVGGLWWQADTLVVVHLNNKPVGKGCEIFVFQRSASRRCCSRALVGLAKDVDLVIGAGDFATRRQGVEDTIEVLAEIEKPSVLVPGNGESVSELESAVKSAGWSSARVLHGTGCKLETVEIWGAGGGIPVTPFGDWSYDFSEAQAESLLAGCKPMSVLVTHSPPLDTVDEDRSGKIRGSQAIRDVVLAKSQNWWCVGTFIVIGGNRCGWEKPSW